jgi:hypothetical protein
MRRPALIAAIILGVLIQSTTIFAESVSVFDRKSKEPLPRKYGIQLSGGFSTYDMKDVNAYTETNPTPLQVIDFIEASSGISYNFALLYRSHDKFNWTIGFSKLGQDKAEHLFVGSPERFNEALISGSEVYFAANYMLIAGNGLNVYIGGGPAIYSANLDFVSTELSSISDAKGRSLGIRFNAGAELFLSDKMGLFVNGGYRIANVKELTYTTSTNSNDQTLFSDSSHKTEADFTGMFVEAGIRLYFEPATEWFKL